MERRRIARACLEIIKLENSVNLMNLQKTAQECVHFDNEHRFNMLVQKNVHEFLHACKQEITYGRVVSSISHKN